MSYTIEQLSGESILLIKGMPDFVMAEGPWMVKEISSALDSVNEKVYVVSDMSRITITMDDMMRNSDVITCNTRVVDIHPNIQESVIVTTSVFVRLAIKGLTSPILGQSQSRLVTSLEDALAYCRTRATTI